MRSFDPSALRAARLEAGLTQQQAAERAGIARTNYVNLETGARHPGPAVLSRLAKAVEVAPRQLSGLTDSEVTLRDLREWAGLRQVDVANALGKKSQVSYGAMEAARATPTEREVQHLAKAFNVDAMEVLEAFGRT